MTGLLIADLSISLDGYGAGPRQTIDEPLGVGGEALHNWFIETRTFKRMGGSEDGETGIDEDFAARGIANVGAYILGRNMFGPIRGPWPDESWRGWWGKNPPYHTSVFVLTHHARQPLEMEGGTVFHFITDGIHSALERSRDVAGSQDVRIGGGGATIRQYLSSGLIDHMHVAVSPILLGSGEHLLAGLDLPALGYRCTESVASTKATHYTIDRTAS